MQAFSSIQSLPASKNCCLGEVLEVLVKARIVESSFLLKIQSQIIKTIEKLIMRLALTIRDYIYNVSIGHVGHRQTKI